jgi:hypothetical protein
VRIPADRALVVRLGRWLQVMTVLILVIPAAAGARQAVRRPTTLRLKFQALQSTAAVSNGPYTYLSAGSFSGTVLREATGQQTPVALPPGCPSIQNPVIGGPWLLDAACQELELYRLPAGPWRAVPRNPALGRSCDGMGLCRPVAIGRHWLDFQSQCYHCAPDYTFENLTSARERSDPTNEGTIPGVNDNKLAHTVCRPVNVVPGDVVTFEGSFALIFMPDPSSPDPEIGSYQLVRCGSTLARTIDAWGLIGTSDALIAANPHMVIWHASTRLDGIFLPSLRRFTVPVPHVLVDAWGLQLSSDHLYAQAGPDGPLYSARLPRRSPRCPAAA